MKVININEYSPKLGKLIDVRHPLDYKDEHDYRSINIYADRLLANPSNYLTKDQQYFIICKHGNLSKMVTVKLTYLGFNVVQVKY